MNPDSLSREEDDSSASANPPAEAPIRAVADADPQKIVHFVTTIKNAEQQVGEHILRALQHTDTVAVLTTVGIGPDGAQNIISAALSPARLAQVNDLLQNAQQERELDETCFGFHCLVEPKPRS